MALRRLRLLPAEPPNSSLVASAYTPLVAAGNAYGGDTGSIGEGTQPWQEQSWSFYHTNGTLNQAIEWFAKSMSQVRLIAAEAQPDEEEPIPLEDGAAVDIVAQLSWDSSSILKDLTTYKFVPGRGYLVGRELGGSGEHEWCAYSPDQVRRKPEVERRRKLDNSIQPVYEIQEDNKRWVSLEGALVVPVRTPDPQFKWADISPVQSQLGVLREIDLYDREIISTLVSRIANNGILLIPQEVTFPSRPEFNDGRDPFVLELIEAAKQSIKDPGSASAAFPLPLKVPARYIENFKHLILAAGVDEKVLVAREKAINQLADGLPMPREQVVGGMADVNHWSGKLISEEAIKTYIAPFASDICHDLTRGFLWPQLVANKQELRGPNGGRIIIWFSTDKLAAKPDKADKAIQAFADDVISVPAYVRELGFSESDIPNKEQLAFQLLLKLINQPQNALTVLAALTGKELEAPATQPATPPTPQGVVGDEPNPDAMPDETTPQQPAQPSEAE